jgi:cytochrome P450 family 144
MALRNVLDFFSLDTIEDPYPLYEQMRGAAPVCQLGESRAFWVGTRDAIEEAVKRHEEFSANLEAFLVCSRNQLPRIHNMALSGGGSSVIATADEPDHAVHRRLMLPPLKAAPVASMEPELREFARRRVQALLKNGGGDGCAFLSEPLPAYVVIQLLDLGEDALEAVQRWAMMGGDLLSGILENDELEHHMSEAMAQGLYLFEHFAKVSARPANERGDSLTATLAGGVEDGLITVEQAVGILVILFGAAGESTASLIGSAIHRMASDQALQARLRAEPALIPNFIEEMVRLESPFKFHYRVVRRPTSLCGTALEAGDLLLLGWAAANRDPDFWEEPDRLNLERPNPERHLGFGYGIHFCIGAPLARLEARVALEELLAGSRSIELDTTCPPLYVPSIFIRRLQHLQLKVS